MGSMMYDYSYGSSFRQQTRQGYRRSRLRKKQSQIVEEKLRNITDIPEKSLRYIKATIHSCPRKKNIENTSSDVCRYTDNDSVNNATAENVSPVNRECPLYAANPFEPKRIEVQTEQIKDFAEDDDTVITNRTEEIPHKKRTSKSIDSGLDHKLRILNEEKTSATVSNPMTSAAVSDISLACANIFGRNMTTRKDSKCEFSDATQSNKKGVATKHIVLPVRIKVNLPQDELKETSHAFREWVTKWRRNEELKELRNEMARSRSHVKSQQVLDKSDSHSDAPPYGTHAPKCDTSKLSQTSNIKSQPNENIRCVPKKERKNYFKNLFCCIRQRRSSGGYLPHESNVTSNVTSSKSSGQTLSTDQNSFSDPPEIPDSTNLEIRELVGDRSQFSTDNKKEPDVMEGINDVVDAEGRCDDVNTSHLQVSGPEMYTKISKTKLQITEDTISYEVTNDDMSYRNVTYDQEMDYETDNHRRFEDIQDTIGQSEFQCIYDYETSTEDLSKYSVPQTVRVSYSCPNKINSIKNNVQSEFSEVNYASSTISEPSEAINETNTNEGYLIPTENVEQSGDKDQDKVSNSSSSTFSLDMSFPDKLLFKYIEGNEMKKPLKDLEQNYVGENVDNFEERKYTINNVGHEAQTSTSWNNLEVGVQTPDITEDWLNKRESMFEDSDDERLSTSASVLLESQMLTDALKEVKELRQQLLQCSTISQRLADVSQQTSRQCVSVNAMTNYEKPIFFEKYAQTIEKNQSKCEYAQTIENNQSKCATVCSVTREVQVDNFKTEESYISDISSFNSATTSPQNSFTEELKPINTNGFDDNIVFWNWEPVDHITCNFQSCSLDAVFSKCNTSVGNNNKKVFKSTINPKTKLFQANPKTKNDKKYKLYDNLRSNHIVQQKKSSKQMRTFSEKLGTTNNYRNRTKNNMSKNHVVITYKENSCETIQEKGTFKTSGVYSCEENTEICPDSKPVIVGEQFNDLIGEPSVLKENMQHEHKINCTFPETNIPVFESHRTKQRNRTIDMETVPENKSSTKDCVIAYREGKYQDETSSCSLTFSLPTHLLSISSTPEDSSRKHVTELPSFEVANCPANTDLQKPKADVSRFEKNKNEKLNVKKYCRTSKHIGASRNCSAHSNELREWFITNSLLSSTESSDSSHFHKNYGLPPSKPASNRGSGDKSISIEEKPEIDESNKWDQPLDLVLTGDTSWDTIASQNRLSDKYAMSCSDTDTFADFKKGTMKADEKFSGILTCNKKHEENQDKCCGVDKIPKKYSRLVPHSLYEKVGDGCLYKEEDRAVMYFDLTNEMTTNKEHFEFIDDTKYEFSNDYFNLSRGQEIENNITPVNHDNDFKSQQSLKSKKSQLYSRKKFIKPVNEIHSNLSAEKFDYPIVEPSSETISRLFLPSNCAHIISDSEIYPHESQPFIKNPPFNLEMNSYDVQGLSDYCTDWDTISDNSSVNDFENNLKNFDNGYFRRNIYEYNTDEVRAVESAISNSPSRSSSQMKSAFDTFLDGFRCALTCFRYAPCSLFNHFTLWKSRGSTVSNTTCEVDDRDVSVQRSKYSVRSTTIHPSSVKRLNSEFSGKQAGRSIHFSSVVIPTPDTRTALCNSLAGNPKKCHCKKGIELPSSVKQLYVKDCDLHCTNQSIFYNDTSQYRKKSKSCEIINLGGDVISRHPHTTTNPGGPYEGISCVTQSSTRVSPDTLSGRGDYLHNFDESPLRSMITRCSKKVQKRSGFSFGFFNSIKNNPTEKTEQFRLKSGMVSHTEVRHYNQGDVLKSSKISIFAKKTKQGNEKIIRNVRSTNITRFSSGRCNTSNDDLYPFTCDKRHVAKSKDIQLCSRNAVTERKGTYDIKKILAKKIQQLEVTTQKYRTKQLIVLNK